MKNLVLLLLFIFLASSAGFAQTEGRRPPTKAKTKNYFVHTSESSKGKNAKAKFRKVNNIRPIIDLNPKTQEKFKTAKAPKNWKWSNGY